jgi:hypothetical protein
MAPYMRAHDRDEVLASGGYTPLGALEDSILMSGGNTWTVLADGEILAVWGVVEICAMTGDGVVWALTSDAVDHHRKEFYKASQDVVRMLKKHFRLLTNMIDARYGSAIKWVKKLGFEVDDNPVAFGASGLPFHRIFLRGDHHV